MITDTSKIDREIEATRDEISKLELKRDKIYIKVEEKRRRIDRLEKEKEHMKNFDDWRKLVGGCFFVESFAVNGIVSNYVYKVISCSQKELYYEYGSIDTEYISDWKKHPHSRGYKNWKKISEEEYKKITKGFKDLREFALMGTAINER
jgi:hypothetical protein